MGLFGFGKRKAKLSEYVVEGHASLIEEARARYKAAVDAEQTQRELELDDLMFCTPDGQWPEQIRNQREEEGRPCLTVDRTNPFIHQLVNDFRQNRPQPNVNPVGDGADKETAEILQGLIRHIAYLSNGDTALDTAYESMGRCGRGYFRILTEYADPMGFEQDIVIKRIPNLHSVVLDPAFTEPDGSDAEFGFITSYMPREVYRKEYPDSNLTTLSDSEWEAVGNSAPEWITDDEGVEIVEYYRRVRKPIKVCLLDDGSTVKKKDLPEGVEPLDERDSFEIEVQWFKLNAIEILDETVWPDSEIPIIPMLGTELYVDGGRTWSGLIRSAKDAARAFNFWKSAQAEAIALAPKAPWVGPKGFMGNMRSLWQNANKRPIAALEYEYLDSNNNPMPPPQRNMLEPPIAAITQAMVGAVDDLKATTGMYDASLGNRESGQSGVAIQRLQRQGQAGNFHYIDNAARSIRRLGRILVRVAPKIYDTKRTVRIVKPDESTDTVTINGPSGQKDAQGIEKVYDLKVGTYDVTVSTGPGYQTKRQENIALLQSLLTTPLGEPLTTLAPDLLVSQMDFAIVPQLVERMKLALPPQVQEKDGQNQQIPPQVQQQMQQEAQLNQALTQRVHELTDLVEELQSKNQADMDKARLDAEAKIEIAKINAEASLREAEIKQGVPGAVQAAEAFMNALSRTQQELGDLQGLVLAMLQGNGHEAMEPPQMEAAEPPHQEQGEAPHALQAPAMTAGPSPAGPMAGMEQGNE